MLRAAFRPAPIASITVAAPVTMSPPANTPAIEVIRLSSASRYPHLLSSSFDVWPMIGLAFVPMAKTTWSVAISNSLPSTGIGRRLPESVSAS